MPWSGRASAASRAGVDGERGDSARAFAEYRDVWLRASSRESRRATGHVEAAAQSAWTRESVIRQTFTLAQAAIAVAGHQPGSSGYPRILSCRGRARFHERTHLKHLFISALAGFPISCEIGLRSARPASRREPSHQPPSVVRLHSPDWRAILIRMRTATTCRRAASHAFLLVRAPACPQHDRRLPPRHPVPRNASCPECRQARPVIGVPSRRSRRASSIETASRSARFVFHRPSGRAPSRIAEFQT